MSEEIKQETKDTTKKRVSTKKAVKKTNVKSNEEFPRHEDGSIDWLKVIPDKFIVAQDKSKSDIPVSELLDHEKMILLGGWKYLLKKRGYIAKHDFIHNSSTEFVSATCRIIWAPHEDSNGIEQTYEASADAHVGNTDSFMQSFLTTCAQNRAFSRCVREYLNIHVVGKDETNKATIDEMLSMNKTDEDGAINSITQNVCTAIQNKLSKKKKGFLDAKKWLVYKKLMTKEEVAKVKDWKDIPLNMCYSMLDYLVEQEKAEIENKKETPKSEQKEESQTDNTENNEQTDGSSPNNETDTLDNENEDDDGDVNF